MRASAIPNADAPGNATLALDTGSHRSRRQLSIGGKSVIYVPQPPDKRASCAASPLQISTEGVSQFVARLARLASKHHVTYVRTVGDAWAETVTRLAGDEVRSDDTANLLVALKRVLKLTDREVASLLIHHQREEKRRVRSLEGL